jgi:hypothetical protein
VRAGSRWNVPGACSHVLLGGEYNNVAFSYLSTDRDLGVITEIFSAPPGLGQKPDAVYPPPADENTTERENEHV